MLFFTRIKLVALVLACARDHTHQMEKTRVTIKRKREESDLVKLLKNYPKEKRLLLPLHLKPSK